MSGATGFGIEPAGRGPRGLRADTPPPSQSDDLHAIRVRYCGPPTLSPQIFSFTANQGARFDLTGTGVNAIILTTMTGQVNLYFGDNSSGFGKAATIPHVVGTATVSANTQVIPISPGYSYIVTLQEGAGSLTTGSVIFIYQ